MAIQVYNTLTRRKEPFETIEPGKVRMYICGPTVYDKAHVGHAMSAIVFDVVRRYLEYRGYQVTHVMNFTDVDDKIIKRSQQTSDDPFELANRYIGEFKRHIAELHILPPTVYPQVSQTMPEIIEMVQTLQESRYAYEKNGDVYFRVRQDDDYGKLSRRKLDEVLSGTRVDVDETKEDVNDFALWKAQKPGEPAWDSPWGPGGQVGTSSARLWPSSTWARRSTSTAAAMTWSFPTTKTRSPKANATPANPLLAIGCTTACYSSAARRCPRASATWSR